MALMLLETIVFNVVFMLDLIIKDFNGSNAFRFDGDDHFGGCDSDKDVLVMLMIAVLHYLQLCLLLKLLLLALFH